MMQSWHCATARIFQKRVFGGEADSNVWDKLDNVRECCGNSRDGCGNVRDGCGNIGWKYYSMVISPTMILRGQDLPILYHPTEVLISFWKKLWQHGHQLAKKNNKHLQSTISFLFGPKPIKECYNSWLCICLVVT